MAYWSNEPTVTMCTTASLSSDDLALIANRARTLDECLAAVAPSGASIDGDPALLQQWMLAFARGDHEAFRRRLEWDGLDLERVRATLARTPALSREELPEWTAFLTETLQHHHPPPGDLALRGADELTLFAPDDPPRFVELWIPFLRCARHRLERRCAAHGELLSAAARRDLERRLLQQLAQLSELAVYECFAAFRGEQTPSQGSRLVYDAFIADQWSGGLVELLREYSVLARLLVRVAETWVESAAEMVERLASDLDLLSTTFADGAHPGRVEGIVPGLSDRHHDGRHVMVLTFESGLRVVYKPKDLGLETAFNDFLSWLTKTGLDPAPAALRTLPRDGFGWVEFVPQTPARDLDHARSYYRRAGALLCVSHLLGGSDLHMDNVIAGPHGPVIVDGESFLEPETRPLVESDQPISAVERAQQRVRESLLNSGLLTFPQVARDGALRDIGGLCGRGGFVASQQRRAWTGANTDTMGLGTEPFTVAEKNNALYLDQVALAAEDFADELADGFTSAYRLVLSHRDQLLADSGPLAAFAGHRTRLILRPTQQYVALQYHLLSPKFLRTGPLRSLLIETLNSPLRGRHERPRLWPLTAEERAALEDLDVPLFSVPIDETVLRTRDGTPIQGHITLSGWHRCLERIAGLSEADLEVQLDLLRAALIPIEHGHVPSASGAGDSADNVISETRPIDSDALVAAAEELARQLVDRAIAGDDGSITWIAPEYLQVGQRSDRGLSYYMYSGTSGIAFFLAAAARITGSDHLRSKALAAFLPIRRVVASDQRTLLLQHEGLGACNGLGGIVYAAALIGAALDDQGSIELAELVASDISDTRIHADSKYDIEGGAAGAILGLLALHHINRSTTALDRATACGHHLLHKRCPADGGGAAWPGPSGLMLAGFAHGASGIGYALARLFAATGAESFRQGARDAFRYESNVFCPRRKNWPILALNRSSGAIERVDATSWCHGAPGVALARAGAIDVVDDGALREELETAVSTSCAAAVSGLDHLCCGTLGVADVLLTAGQDLHRDSLIRGAEARTAFVLRRATTTGRFSLRLDASENRSFSPGLFRGISGIGYQLLRTAHPDSLPSVLAFRPAPHQEGG